MSQSKYLLAGLLFLGVTGYSFADESDAKAECQAMAEEQGVADVEAFVSKCIQEKSAEQSQ